MGFFIQNADLSGKTVNLVASEVFDFDQNENIFTVLIGKNGTGKSIFLSKLSSSICGVKFNNKYMKRTLDYIEFDKSSISFLLNHDGNASYLSALGREIFNPEVSYSQLPESLTCITTSPFDKFISDKVYYNKNPRDSFYNYFGMKDTGRKNAVYLFFEKMIFNYTHLDEFNDKRSVRNILEFLNYLPEIDVEFRFRYSLKNIISLNDEELINKIESPVFGAGGFIKKYKISDGFSLVDIREAISYFNGEEIQKQIGIINSRSRTFELKIDSGDGSAIFNLNDNTLYHLTVLLRCDLISLHRIFLYREKEGKIMLEHASSGEQCLMVSTLGIASSLQNNSLVLIDEPEISLHPEWQEVYIELLMEVFKHKSGCHFIIATHSPQIISNLNRNNCFITKLEDGSCYSSNLFINKSADFQLAKLMEAPGNDNEYLKRIAINLLSKISNNQELDFEDIESYRLLTHLKSKLDKDDNILFLLKLIDKSNGIKVND